MQTLIATVVAWRKSRRLKPFSYRYLRYPFDDWQYFKVKAEDQTAADAAAVAQYTQMFEKGHTTMLEFHAA